MNVYQCTVCGGIYDDVSRCKCPDRSDNVTRRDFFAAFAMMSREFKFYMGKKETDGSLACDAEECFAIADAMIEASETARAKDGE